MQELFININDDKLSIPINNKIKLGPIHDYYLHSGCLFVVSLLSNDYEFIINSSGEHYKKDDRYFFSIHLWFGKQPHWPYDKMNISINNTLCDNINEVDVRCMQTEINPVRRISLDSLSNTIINFFKVCSYLSKNEQVIKDILL